MPLPAIRRTAAMVAAAFAAACAGAPRPTGTVAYERCLPLPADTAAMVTAGAIRHLLPFADPVPQAAGAPASPLADGAFAIVYERCGDGPWVPRASHRLHWDAAGHLTAVPQRGALALPGFRGAATERLTVQVQAGPRGASVVADLPPGVAADAAQVLDRAFALAADPDAHRAGLTEPNLARLTGTRAVAAAQVRLAHGEPARAEELLLQALRLDALSPGGHRQLGELAAHRGDTELARERLAGALLRSDDPCTRACIAARLHELGASVHEQATHHRAEWRPGSAADRAATSARLHTARRLAPAPDLDYLLAGRLHRQNDDELASLACALLAREHAAATALAGSPLAHRGLDDFLRTVVRGIEPVAAGLADDGTTQPAAAPGP
ncbi:MAG: hypothetical protein JNL08_18375 [Planctomycetes bacterium]|nr:hypothetical protein [Planctomycetota bacterium]